MKRIYFDNAATTPVAPAVVEEMTTVLREHFGNPSSIHAEGRTARALVELARKTVAHGIGASTADVFFTSCGTESNNMAIKCAVRDLGVRHIISSPTEHHCGLHTIENVAQYNGVAVTWLPVDALGRVDTEALEQALSRNAGERTLVSLMHANNEIGTMLDLDQVAALCRQYSALFHSDTVQTIGQYPIDVRKTPVHFLSGSAHKFHGPKGVGFIYIHPDNPIRPFIDGGAQERNMRGGTENVAGIAGLAKALELALADMDERATYIRSLRQYMLDQLREHIPDVQFNGDYAGRSLYKLLSVSFPPSLKNELLLLQLDIAGISASGGSACASGAEKGSHVLAAINADPERRSVRFSFSQHNTKAEVDIAVAKLKAIFHE